MCDRRVFQCILFHLLRTDTESVQKPLRHAGRHHGAVAGMKIQTVQNSQILHLVVRMGGEKRFVAFLRDQLRKKHVLGLFVADTLIADSYSIAHSLILLLYVSLKISLPRDVKG